MAEATAIASDVHQGLKGVVEVGVDELKQHVEAAIRTRFGSKVAEDYARRHKLTRWVRESETPVIILIGGATGTGKSTLALELAYRLGVDWVTSTDMIRETMRAVVSPALLPGLHDHSFRGMLIGGQVLSNPRERVLAGFRQQAAQVAVGIEAVLQRAIYENTHIIIEGTHLVPPFAQYVPLDVRAHVAGFILSVPDELEHRARFPERSRQQPGRSAETYLDAFQSVRWIHDDLVRLAEETGTVVLPNVERNRTLSNAVNTLSRELSVEASREPNRDRERNKPRRPSLPTLILILDGLADEPHPALGGKTPLAAAHTPTARHLAFAGGQGQVVTGHTRGQVPNTDEGILALLGNPEQLRGHARGLFEALGQGISLPAGAVLFRGNLATVDAEGGLLDRRAGRIRSGVEELLADLRHVELSGGITAKVFPGHEHRILVMLIGAGLSPAVCDTDPGSDALIQRVLTPAPLDDSPEAARTTEALNELSRLAATKLQRHPSNAERVAQGLLPANAIITRGAAAAPSRRVVSSWSGAMVARCNTALGVARYLGLKVATSPRMTGSLDTDIDAKFAMASELLESVDCVVVHVKGADIAGHDRKPLEKCDFISRIDASLGRFLASRPDLSGRLRIVISADHGTSSLTGDHLATPVPLLLATWNAEEPEEQADFSEESASRGALGILQPGDLVELLGLGHPPPSLIPPG